MTKLPRQTVWITRTEPSAGDSARAFQAAGFNVITAPLLTVQPVQTHADVPDNAVLIFTSQNGVRAFCGQDTRRDFPVVTVGGGTADLARSQGFSNVRSAGGTSDDIAPLISAAPDNGAVYLHISGNHVRGSVSQDLKALGLKAERRIYYRSAPVHSRPDIDFSSVDIAVFFSPLAAQTLVSLDLDTSHMTAVCISRATQMALGALVFKDCRIAKAPTLESLIAACAATG